MFCRQKPKDFHTSPANRVVVSFFLFSYFYLRSRRRSRTGSGFRQKRYFQNYLIQLFWRLLQTAFTNHYVIEIRASRQCTNVNELLVVIFWNSFSLSNICRITFFYPQNLLRTRHPVELRLGSPQLFDHFLMNIVVDKSTDHGKPLSIC